MLRRHHPGRWAEASLRYVCVHHSSDDAARQGLTAPRKRTGPRARLLSLGARCLHEIPDLLRQLHLHAQHRARRVPEVGGWVPLDPRNIECIPKAWQEQKHASSASGSCEVCSRAPARWSSAEGPRGPRIESPLPPRRPPPLPCWRAPAARPTPVGAVPPHSASAPPLRPATSPTCVRGCRWGFGFNPLPAPLFAAKMGHGAGVTATDCRRLLDKERSAHASAACEFVVRC